jgi:hypothetical protein
VAENFERVHVRVDPENYIPAFAPIPAIGAAAVDILFLMEMNHAIPTFSGTDFNIDLINKHGLIIKQVFFS